VSSLSPGACIEWILGEDGCCAYSTFSFEFTFRSHLESIFSIVKYVGVGLICSAILCIGY